jgi:hypothetical protein
MIDMYDKTVNPENAQRYHNQDIDMEDIYVMSVKSWPLLLRASAHLLGSNSISSRICACLLTATLPQISLQ